MFSFLAGVVALIVGYIVYGAFVERTFAPDDRLTPAKAHPDGVDYVELPMWKAFLIQLLNIAGLGPIFGAISGAIWGPSVYLWIVFGTIFAGAVHDFLSGMLSIRNDGASISEITGMYLGDGMKTVMRIFSVVLLVMVGVVFMVGPAGLLALMTGTPNMVWAWTLAILIYYFLATLLPIDKVIGRFYPIFGVCLIIMAVGVAGMTLMNQGTNPMMELTLDNLHPKGLPIWPLMFITVACGAISGFHATQSPMMARCIGSERQGRRVFYGAMVAEGLIALVWAAAAIAFFKGTDGILAAGGGGPKSVYAISIGLMGTFGGFLAMLGVVACPITSGDTAFRSARLTLADWFKIDQSVISKRLALSIPLLLIGYAISFVPYGALWRYFSWSNQTLAMIALWAGAVYLASCEAKPSSAFIAAIPATFMSAVSCTYIIIAPEGLKMSSSIAYPVGIIFAIGCFVTWYTRTYKPACARAKK